MKTSKILIIFITKPKSFIWIFLILKSILKVIVRRQVFGSLRPDWPLKLELLVEILRLRNLPKQKLTHVVDDNTKITYFDIKNGYFPLIRKRWVAMSIPPHKHFRQTFQYQYINIPVSFPAASNHLLPTTPNISYSSVSVELITNSQVNDGITILYLHGGGYCMGAPKTYERMVSLLMKYCNAKQAFVVDYHLAPEFPFPHSIVDSFSVYKYLLSEGISNENIVIMGDSAGGGLTLSTSLFLRDTLSPLPRSIVCISPWTDLVCSGSSWITNQEYDYLNSREEAVSWAVKYSNGVHLRHPLISPLFADLSNLPRVLIQVGGSESLLDDSRSLYQSFLSTPSMKEKVVYEEYDNMIHVFQMFGKWAAPSYPIAFENIARFVNNTNNSLLSSSSSQNSLSKMRSNL